MTDITTALVFGIDVHRIKVEINTIPANYLKLSFIGISPISRGVLEKKILSIFSLLDIQLPYADYIINLSPTELNKPFISSFELPILIALLNRVGYLSDKAFKLYTNSIIVGELSLSGEILPINGAISIALSFNMLGKKSFIIPEKNTQECSVIEGINLITIKNVHQLKEANFESHKTSKLESLDIQNDIDLNQIIGQDQAKRVLEIAAAGHHHILFYGAPGSGKTMLAQRICTIMPDMLLNEKIQTTQIYSSAGLLNKNSIITKRPFRNPHHSSSLMGIVGGGRKPYPGEISLAHNGVLFLDEFPEFSSYVLESLRQVLEENKVHIKRAEYSISYPASFLLIAALNPCPCGYYGDREVKCSCGFSKIKNYLSKISGPVLDRIDMQIGLQRINLKEIDYSNNCLSSKEIKTNVTKAVEKQYERNKQYIFNGLIPGYLINKFAFLTPESKKYLDTVFDKLKLSMRSYHKIIKISRTIADLDNSKNIEIKHIQEALMYRSFDKLLSSLNE